MSTWTMRLGGLWIIACAMSAAEVSPQMLEALRTEEARQNALAEETARAADHLAELVTRYRANGVGDDTSRAAIAAWAAEISSIAKGQGASTITMPAVVARLAAARHAEQTKSELLAASQAMEGIAERLGRVADAGQKAFGSAGQAIFGQLADRQDALRVKTQKLSGETKDRPIAGLDADLKADVASLGGAQRMLAPAFETGVANLQTELAQLAGAKPARAEALRAALAAVAEAGIPAQIASAAERIASGALSSAASQQQAIADTLRRIGSTLDSALKQADAKTTGAMLISGFQQLIERQKNITTTAGRFIAATPTDAYTKLGSEQSEVAVLLNEVNEQAGKVEAITKALLAMDVAVKSAKTKDRDRLKQATALALKFLENAPTIDIQVENPTAVVTDEQKNKQDEPFATDPKFAKRGQLTAYSNIAWQAALPPREREILEQASKEALPPRYARDLGLYFDMLAGDAARAKAQGGQP